MRERLTGARRWGGLAAIASGIAWGAALPLVATAASRDPVGWRYDDWNRLLAVPIALLLLALVALRRLGDDRFSAWGRRGAVVAIAGTALLLAGNVIEFWLVLLSDADVYAIAEPRGLDEWVGSTVGWLAFLLGALLLFVGTMILGRSAGRASVLPSWAGFGLGLVAPLLLLAFVFWSVSLAATIPFGLAVGGVLAAVGASLLRAR